MYIPINEVRISTFCRHGAFDRSWGGFKFVGGQYKTSLHFFLYFLKILGGNVLPSSHIRGIYDNSRQDTSRANPIGVKNSVGTDIWTYYFVSQTNIHSAYLKKCFGFVKMNTLQTIEIMFHVPFIGTCDVKILIERRYIHNYHFVYIDFLQRNTRLTLFKTAEIINEGYDK